MDIPNRLTGFLQEYVGITSYSCLKLHEEMLRDRLMSQFKELILTNRHLFEGKIVLDVDCGTAILSLLIASQGASKVIGIEPSHLAEHARKNVEHSDFGDVVSIIQASVHKIECLPFDIEKVDIIVSQWLGFLIFDETLLNTLIEARVKWLKSDGLMFPESLILRIAAVEYDDKKKEIFNLSSFEGFNFNALIEPEFEVPKIEIIPPQRVLTDSAVVRQINLKKYTSTNASAASNFVLTSFREDAVHAFVLFFEVGFLHCHKRTYLSTSPFERPTRWKQIVLCFQNRLWMKQNEQIRGVFTLQSGSRGSLKFNVSVDFSGVCCETEFSNNYRL